MGRQGEEIFKCNSISSTVVGQCYQWSNGPVGQWAFLHLSGSVLPSGALEVRYFLEDILKRILMDGLRSTLCNNMHKVQQYGYDITVR